MLRHASLITQDVTWFKFLRRVLDNTLRGCFSASKTSWILWLNASVFDKGDRNLNALLPEKRAMRRFFTIALMITSTIAWSQFDEPDRHETIRRAGMGISDPMYRRMAEQKAADSYDRRQQSQQQMELHQQQMEQQNYYQQENMRLQQEAEAQEQQQYLLQQQQAQAQAQANRTRQQALANASSGGTTTKIYKCKDNEGGTVFTQTPCGEQSYESPPQQKQYSGDRINLNFKDMDIKPIFKMISDFSGVSIVVSDRVGGTIDMVENNIPWDEALDKILNSSGLVAVAFNGVLYVGLPGENLGFK